MKSLTLDQFFGTGNLEAYLRTGRAIIRIAEKDFSIPLRTETKEKISDLFRSIYWVDHYIDSLDSSVRKEAALNIIGFLNHTSLTFTDAPEMGISLCVLRDNLDALPAEQKTKFLKKVQEIFECAKILSSTQNPDEFIKARRTEGECTADLFLISFAELGKNQRFAKFFRRTSSLGNFVDSIVDFFGDKKRGEIVIGQPLDMYFRFVSAVLADAASAAHSHPNKRAFMGHAARGIIYMRALRHGEQARPRFLDRSEDYLWPKQSGAAPHVS